jgi:competence protein ComEA
LDQSTPAWRVFDAAAASGQSSPGDGPGPSSGVTSTIPSPRLLVAAAALIGALVIGAAAFVVAMSGSRAAVADGPAAVPGPIAAVSPAAQLGEIVVDVAGAVAKPGIYHLAVGARVGDAIDAAGGFGPRVDVGRVAREVNLAAALSDGDQVRIPSRDDPSTAPVGGGGSSEGGGLVNLNTASQSELEALPGIGPVTAEKIIAARADAPFRTVEELRERGLVGEKTFAELQPLVTAG